MTTSVQLHYEEFGKGRPVVALHGLGLEGSAFIGLARQMAELGLRTLSADLPGFGKTPLPDAPLSPAVLAEPVLELARRLESKPLVMGMSLGARVALEAALRGPELFRGVVMLAPPLPSRERSFVLPFARLLSPKLFELFPLERAWPWLKERAARTEAELAGDTEHDWFYRASRRAIYYFSCPATRWAFVSAARELALDPPFGPEGVWTRLGGLKMPAAFVWGDKDKFIPMKDVPRVAELVPDAFQIHVTCAGHYKNGPHFRCVEQATLEAVRAVESAAAKPRRAVRRARPPRHAECVVGADRREAETRRAVSHP